MDTASPAGGPPARLASVDAYRGFVMLAMASAGLGLARVAANVPENTLLEQIAAQVEHVAWRGCSFWDLIQPSFIFLVGVAMPYSYASRRARGQTERQMLAHALVRAAVLVLLGVFLATAWKGHSGIVFTNVLSQIGLGYPFVFLLLGRSPAVQAGAAGAILVADWALFALYPLPGPEFSYASVGLGPHWDFLPGFLAHWEKHTNAAAAFDAWFLNLFPRPGGRPYTRNPGGYATLNFIPSIATMLFGVLAGRWLRSGRPRKTGPLVVAGAAGLAAGLLLDDSVCPIVKRIWTPSWTLYSAGWTCLMLAGFHDVIDVKGFRRWAFPLVVVGVNSIAMYVMAQLMKPWVRGQLTLRLGDEVFRGLGPAYEPLVESAAVLLVLWLICLWLYRNRIFIRI